MELYNIDKRILKRCIRENTPYYFQVVAIKLEKKIIYNTIFEEYLDAVEFIIKEIKSKRKKFKILENIITDSEGFNWLIKVVKVKEKEDD